MTAFRANRSTTRHTAGRAAAALTALATALAVAPAAAGAAPVTAADPARSGITDDQPSVIAEPPEVLVPEGRSGTFNVRLSHQPSTTLYLFIQGTGTGIWAAPPVLLTFSPSDWSTPKWYSMYSMQDADTVDDVVTLTLSATGYQSASVTLRQIDDD